MQDASAARSSVSARVEASRVLVRRVVDWDSTVGWERRVVEEENPRRGARVRGS